MAIESVVTAENPLSVVVASASQSAVKSAFRRPQKNVESDSAIRSNTLGNESEQLEKSVPGRMEVLKNNP